MNKPFCFCGQCSIAGVVEPGAEVVLTCSYTVSPGQYIDSIKWYLNSSECYRIVPGLHKDRYGLQPNIMYHCGYPCTEAPKLWLCGVVIILY